MTGREKDGNHSGLASLDAKCLAIPREKITLLSKVYQKLGSIIDEIEGVPDQTTIDYQLADEILYSIGRLGDGLSKRLKKITKESCQLFQKGFLNQKEYDGLMGLLISSTIRWCNANPKGSSFLWGRNFSSAIMKKEALMILIYFLVTYQKYYSPFQEPRYRDIAVYLYQEFKIVIDDDQLYDRFRKYDPDKLRWRYDLFRFEVSYPAAILSDPRLSKLPNWQSLHPPGEKLDYTINVAGLVAQWCESNIRQEFERLLKKNPSDPPVII